MALIDGGHESSAPASMMALAMKSRVQRWHAARKTSQLIGTGSHRREWRRNEQCDNVRLTIINRRRWPLLVFLTAAERSNTAWRLANAQ